MTTFEFIEGSALYNGLDLYMKEQDILSQPMLLEVCSEAESLPLNMQQRKNEIALSLSVMRTMLLCVLE